MEQVGEEVVAGNADLQPKSCSLPLKFDGGIDAPPPAAATSPCPVDNSLNAVQEFTVKGSHSTRDQEEKGKWKQMCQLPSGSAGIVSLDDYVSGDENIITLTGAGGRLTRVHSDLWGSNRFARLPSGPNPWLMKQNGHHGINMSSNINLTGGDTRFKTIPESHQALGRRDSKGKQIISPKREAFTEFGGAVAGDIDENLGYAMKVASDALAKSNANRNRLSLHRMDSPCPGISLREWLLPGSRRRDKVASFMIFRQILGLVDSAHSQGVALRDLQPSRFNLLQSNRIIYTGSYIKKEPAEAATFPDSVKKRPREQGVDAYCEQQQKQSQEIKYSGQKSFFTSSCGFRPTAADEIDCHLTRPLDLDCSELESQNHSNCQSVCKTTMPQSNLILQFEEKWYRSPEQLSEKCSTFSSNIYNLGVLLFELLSWFESGKVHSAAMFDLRHRILPPNFLSENPKEAGFCVWLLHPEPSSRPTARELLQSELVSQSLEICSETDLSTSPEKCDAESEVLLHFLNLLKKQKEKRALKLAEDIECLEEDFKDVQRRHSSRTSAYCSQTQEKFPGAKNHSLHPGDVNSILFSMSTSMTNANEVRFLKNLNQIEDVYYSMRSQIRLNSYAPRSDISLLKNRDRRSSIHDQKDESNMDKKSFDPLGEFFEGLWKFAQYRKFEVCGSVKIGDLLSSTNVVCALSFDRHEDFIAVAGVSKKIKVFEFGSLLNESMDICYPVVEMSNKSKLSCACWNNYIKNYLASTDYDGAVQMWDAGTGRRLSKYLEHQKRAWSVDFSVADPLMFASGSDDCSVKLWSINEINSIGTIWNPANVCCVQFSASSSHLLGFGSADYKVYCYDLRNTKIPWCTLAGHEKAVSYVKFLDAETIVSASTDNTLKLWDLNKTSSTELSASACSLTFRGHKNEKNFVGLSALNGYIACGSETNEVFSYYRSMPMPIISHKFGYVDPISGNEVGDDSGQFVSSVCWRQKSNMIVAANSCGSLKLLQMV